MSLLNTITGWVKSNSKDLLTGVGVAGTTFGIGVGVTLYQPHNVSPSSKVEESFLNKDQPEAQATKSLNEVKNSKIAQDVNNWAKSLQSNGDANLNIKDLMAYNLSDRYALRPALKAKPKIAVVLTGYGLNKDFAINLISKSVTLSLAPYVNIESVPQGYELWASVPMETIGHQFEGGDMTVLTGDIRSIKNIEKYLNIYPSIEGVVGEGGSLFTASPIDMQFFLKLLSQKKLAFLDPKTSIGSAALFLTKQTGILCAETDNTITPQHSLEEIQTILKEVEKIALETGWGIVKIPARPLLAPYINAWVESFSKKGFTLTPLKSLINDIRKATVEGEEGGDDVSSDHEILPKDTPQSAPANDTA